MQLNVNILLGGGGGGLLKWKQLVPLELLIVMLTMQDLPLMKNKSVIFFSSKTN